MYFIDVQGTLLSDSDKNPINGACELIYHLNKEQIPYVVITNNTKAPSSDFLDTLRKKGLQIKDNAYIDPFCTLCKILPPTNTALFGANEFIRTMEKMGYMQDFKTPKAVLIASYDDFKFDEFATMNELILNGAKFIAMHETSIYKKNNKLYPGVGAIAKMINYATNADCTTIGKPSKAFYDEALRLINLQKNCIKFNDITIISDDAKGDLMGAKQMGMKTALVLSGKVKNLDQSGVGPEVVDDVYNDVGEFLTKKVLNAKY